ncbi:MAG: hypothetical protein DME44_00690 [Verrucomicrobia bacterium]|nr:MAG: hypothetical protein DME44_00690 [Verrucomicrobiota bacterium]
MYSVEADRLKRLLVISAAGEVTKKEVENAALQIREIMKEITPGFRVLADFRWLDRMEPAAAAHLAEIMDVLAAKDVAAVVRVVPDPHKDIGLNILSQFPLPELVASANWDGGVTLWHRHLAEVPQTIGRKAIGTEERSRNRDGNFPKPKN